MDNRLQEAKDYVKGNVVWINPLRASAEQYRKSIDILIDNAEQTIAWEGKMLDKINGEYQCEHSKNNIVNSDCIWCNLTVGEKIAENYRKIIQKLDVGKIAEVIDKSYTESERKGIALSPKEWMIQ